MGTGQPLNLYMSSPVATVSAEASLRDAEELLRQRKVSGLAVVADDGRLLGVLSRTDILRVSESKFSDTGKRAMSLILPAHNVAAAMTTEVVTVDVEESIAGAAAVMWSKRIHRVFVLAQGMVVGALSTRDVMRAIGDARVEGPLSHLMTAPMLTIDAHESAAEAAKQLADELVSGLVVVEHGHPVGVFGQDEALITHHLDAKARVDWVMSSALFTLPAEIPMFRAAQRASSVDVRRIIVRRDDMAVGVVSGLDFCRLATEL